MPAKPAKLFCLFICLPWTRPEKKKRKSPHPLRGPKGASGEEKDQQVLLRERDKLQPEGNINRERPGGIISKINSNYPSGWRLVRLSSEACPHSPTAEGLSSRRFLLFHNEGSILSKLVLLLLIHVLKLVLMRAWKVISMFVCLLCCVFSALYLEFPMPRTFHFPIQTKHLFAQRWQLRVKMNLGGLCLPWICQPLMGSGNSVVSYVALTFHEVSLVLNSCGVFDWTKKDHQWRNLGNF